MNNSKFFIFLYICAIFISGEFLQSCTKDLDEPLQSITETINGFEVEWRTQITVEQKNTITEILNDMVAVEGDFFVMGATPEQAEMARPNEYPNAYVYLSDYHIGGHEVNDAQYNAIMGAAKTSSERYPRNISLSEWTLFVDVLKDLTGLNFNFPSEAQWEYAARGGKHSKGYIYPGSDTLEDVRSTSIINGSQVPNELGLCNLADLKSEWCLDFYNDLVSGSILTDWIQLNGEYRVVRGGNYLCTATTNSYYPNNSSDLCYRLAYGTTAVNNEQDYRQCRISSRSYSYKGNSYIGCRLVIN